MQHSPPKWWYLTTSLYSITTQKSMTRFFVTVKTSSLVSVWYTLCSFFTLSPVNLGTFKVSRSLSSWSVQEKCEAALWTAWSGVRVLAGAENFPLHHHVQTSFGVNPASCPMGTRGSFLGVKAAESWRWPLTSI